MAPPYAAIQSRPSRLYPHSKQHFHKGFIRNIFGHNAIWFVIPAWVVFPNQTGCPNESSVCLTFLEIGCSSLIDPNIGRVKLIIAVTYAGAWHYWKSRNSGMRKTNHPWLKFPLLNQLMYTHTHTQIQQQGTERMNTVVGKKPDLITISPWCWVTIFNIGDETWIINKTNRRYADFFSTSDLARDREFGFPVEAKQWLINLMWATS